MDAGERHALYSRIDKLEWQVKNIIESLNEMNKEIETLRGEEYNG